MVTTDTARSAGLNRYIPALTGLRAIAAYLVFIHHYNPVMTANWIHRLIDQGYIGVSIFFVLSGFLIYHRYADAYFSRVNWSWKAYYQNRFARIGPLYLLLLLITVCVTSVRGQPMSEFALLLNLTLTKGFFDQYKFSGIAPSWSLTVEECFYVSAPLLFFAVRRRGGIWLAALLTGMGVLLWLTVGQLNWHGLFGNLPFIFFYTFFGRSFEFMVGMWVACNWHQNKLPYNQYAITGSFGLLGICVGWQVYLTGQTTNPTVLVCGEVIAYMIMLPIGIGLLVVGLLQESSGLQRLLAQPIMQALGRSSYAFYLIHTGVISKLIQHKLTGTNLWLLFTFLLLIASGLYTWVEKPLQQRLRASRNRVTNPSTP